ncbi:Chromosome segregation protein Spo0J, containings ParB-like nuclease domain [Nostoc flagelliforme CCNUN1]|uniref:Chromosome segregation protein Spo0J, containings ParB-like nuclease domain n=2 Tax=Nostoc flagelliforme TaxID=1306274 RepID=A0A2K8SL44_9NOSO|nr:Chromosome segregation protein Spo0J, containings ParB-like nuclease domain [Nostoc flagelliforme CCNUN1]
MHEGGVPTVLVCWEEDGTPMPEQPALLEVDEVANSGMIKVGDLVRVTSCENGQIIGSRLDFVEEIQARGWILVSNNQVLPIDRWQTIDDPEFDRGDFDWIIGASWGDINVQNALVRASYSTVSLALEFVKQRPPAGNKTRIAGLERKLKQLENGTANLPPIERLRELAMLCGADYIMRSPTAALKANPKAVDMLVTLAEAVQIAADDKEVIDKLTAEAQDYALEQGLRLDIDSDGYWLIHPICNDTASALALCPSVGERVLMYDSPATVISYACTEGGQGVQVEVALQFDDEEEVLHDNGFFLEEMPLLLALESIEPIEPIESVESVESVDDGNVQVAPAVEVEDVPAVELLAVEPVDDGNVQVAPAVELLPVGIYEVSVDRLRSHPINSKIYGEQEDDTALEEMIESSGWIKPLLVTRDGDVVGGNRRLRTAKKKGIRHLIVEVREFDDEADVLEALLLDNAVREKTVEQKVREARFWLPIESAKAKSRKGRSSENQENFPGGSKGQVRDIVAARVGLGSGKNFQKADKVLAIIEADPDSDGAKALLELLNNKSIHYAHRVVCEAEQKPAKWTPKLGEKVTVSLKAEQYAGVSGSVVSAEGTAGFKIRFDEPSDGMETDVIYAALLLPADFAAAATRIAEEEAAKNPAKAVGLSGRSSGSGLLPEQPRNEGFAPNADENLSVPSTPSAPSNVINMPTRPESAPAVNGDAVAAEIAKGMRYLTPDNLAWAITWASNDETNPLTDEHLQALMGAATYIWDKRHPQDVDAAN